MNYKEAQLQKVKNAIERSMNGLRGTPLTDEEGDDLKSFLDDLLVPWLTRIDED